MSDALIGGIIAAGAGAAFGIITSLCLEHRREKAQRLATVDALIAEINDNLRTLKSPAASKMWWFEQYRIETYDAYKAQLLFLGEDVQNRLGRAVRTLRGINTAVEMHILRVGYGQKVTDKPIQIPQGLIKDLEFANEKLQEWRKKHSHCRLFNLVYDKHRRLRNFISKIRNNSKLNHS